ncbi:1742_t:CDS:2 [Scutellospora calospora]|uniref:1742_t:CDS:1 n=1 Tax=Scutellospora calospora TaxID=85575 RepID=A0ACA9JU61_9GLOM|nr:1742_t:CDS:2 [Scutellospora calospora]
MRTELKISTSAYLQTNRQTEHINRIFKEVLYGKLQGIISLKKLLTTIDREKYWLVEVESNENPPICKLVEKKLVYEKGKKHQQQNTLVTKELQMTWKVDEHDLMHKVGRAKSWLIKGYKVEIVISNRGVQKKKRTLDRTIMDKILNELKDYSKEIQEPKWTGGAVILKMTALLVNCDDEQLANFEHEKGRQKFTIVKSNIV